MFASNDEFEEKLKSYDQIYQKLSELNSFKKDDQYMTIAYQSIECMNSIKTKIIDSSKSINFEINK